MVVFYFVLFWFIFFNLTVSRCVSKNVENVETIV